ncbi:MAG TPA: phosphatase PAP2 family protein [Candidatus Corynebacterium gallistercoris]|uniref:Phosphatase PAP2 family protein n=1 Tax=Candidatus Corynebacterium gallistercoris TaxID=2838530 RepID=A0A9D1S064_9CORY|nr:phosphatase PAP2 family protein [Candidatus Corynebacterium gallistercoris]
MSEKITGDPLGESQVLVAIQNTLADKPGVLAGARALSHFGEHALGWIGTAAAGYAVAYLQGKPEDSPERIGWLTVGASAFTAHAASVVLKRIVRRPRPHHPDIRIGVGTPSKLSFPSSHATSSTAALVAMANMWGNPAPLVGIPTMATSRLVLGVHYPTDVALGSVIGATTAMAAKSTVGRVVRGRRRTKKKKK